MYHARCIRYIFSTTSVRIANGHRESAVFRGKTASEVRQDVSEITRTPRFVSQDGSASGPCAVLEEDLPVLDSGQTLHGAVHPRFG